MNHLFLAKDMLNEIKIQLMGSLDQSEEFERMNQLRKFFKFIILYFACPTMMAMSVTDSYYQENSAKLMLLLRIVGTILMLLACLVTIRQKSLLWMQIWATLTGICGYAAVQYMFYYRGLAESPFIFALMPALVIVATGIRLTWAFYFLNCALIYLPMVVIGFVVSSGDPGPMFYINITNWLLVFSFCTSGRWFFEKIYAQERMLRIALKNEINQREVLLSQAIDDLISGDQVSKVLVERVPRLVQQWEILTSKLNDYKEKEADIISSKRLADQARQVAHDIRSPLSALSLITETLREIPEEKRLIVKAAATRINDIANELLSKGNKGLAGVKADSEEHLESEVIMLPAVVDQLASEKRAQYGQHGNIRIETNLSESFGAFVLAQSRELLRLLSNLVDNSIEALHHGGTVMITTKNLRDHVILTIRDNGSGIPAEILKNIGQKGYSFGKNKATVGAGLGVYHAKKMVLEMGGEFELRSVWGQGTVVEIKLKKAVSPGWFPREILMKPNLQVVIMDDDQSIHQLWKSRFREIAEGSVGVSVTSFTSPVDFLNYFTQSREEENRLFLIDFELISHSENGLELIKRLGIEKTALLVTSHWDEGRVQKECELSQIRLLPKSLSGFIPLRVETIDGVGA